MPPVEHDGYAARPDRRSEAYVVAGIALVIAIIVWQGFAMVLLVAWLAVIVALAVSITLAIVRTLRD